MLDYFGIGRFRDIVWHFASGDDLPPKAENVIEFPIFEQEPTDKDEVKRYERKVQGIANANVLSLIKEMQPYKVGADLPDHALFIIHNMDRFDKHRELVIINSTVEVNFPPTMPDLQRKADLFTRGKLPQSEYLTLSHALNDYARRTPSVGFKNFGRWSPYSVVKGLSTLWWAINNAVAEFSNEV